MTTAKNFRPLTECETAALRAFAREHGPAWKARLADLWYRAAAQPTLHCLRNSHGPAWLESFAMEQPARIVTGGLVVVERGSKTLGIRKGQRLSVVSADPATVLLLADDRSHAVAFTGVDGLTAMVTELRDAAGAISVRAIGCEAPRE